MSAACRRATPTSRSFSREWSIERRVLQIPSDADALRTFRRSLEPGARRAPSGAFATLVFDAGGLEHREEITCAVASRATVSEWRRHALSESIAHRRHAPRVQFEAALSGWARGHRSIGFDGHRSGRTGSTRRACSRGAGRGLQPSAGRRECQAKRVDLGAARHLARHFPSGNVGNGVDGPVLRWAIARARSNEPIVWVTDGQVTDSNDHPSDALTAECAALVTRHRIRLVRTFSDAATALARHRPLVHSDFGRVGRKMLENRAL